MQKYSVLMTMYKGDNPKYARLSIDSMLNQTVKTDDFVLVCDGPLTPELDALLDEYQNNNTFFHVYRLPQNVGLGAALRYGVTVCKNELIARMDDDDIALPHRCELELREFEKDINLDICGSFMNEFESDPKDIIRIKKVPLVKEEILTFSRRRNPFNHSTVMFKKVSILSVGNYSPMRTNQDVDLWVRALNKGVQGMNIPEPLVNFRFDSSTYGRRKNWKNVKLMIDVWAFFRKNGYCSFADFIYVSLMQMAAFVMPQKCLEWAYNHLR